MVSESQASAEAVASFHEEMEGDFELMKEMPKWDMAVSDFLSAALGQNKDVEVSSASLSTFLVACLAKAAPAITPPSAAVVSYHPSSSEVLKVFAADEASQLTMGATLRDRGSGEKNAVVSQVWSVMRTGQPQLNNAHGIARDKDKHSIAPLKSTANRTFGVVLTGPPPVPDQLLEMLCRQAGPLLEQVWKLERAKMAILNVITFIKRYTLERQSLVYACFKEGEHLSRPEQADTWSWQPLVHNPNRPDLFELQLKWRLGTAIGVLEVSCGNYTPMDAHLTVLLHVMANVLTAAIETIEDLTPGDASPLLTVLSVLEEFERTRAKAPAIVRQESHQQLQVFNAASVFSELASFEAKTVDGDMLAVLMGALCLMGARRKSLGSWEACRKSFRNSRRCHEAMVEVMGITKVAVTPKEMATRWAEFNMCIKDKGQRMILNKALYDRSPASVKLLIRWVTIARMEYNISDSIQAELAPPPADPLADQIFDAIDTDEDGRLTPNELKGYLLHRFPTSFVHKTVKILDTDQDKMISRNEWRRGWADGLLTDFLQKEMAKADGDKLMKKGGKAMGSKKKLEPIGAKAVAPA